jgi:hypothetical protein
LTQRKLTADERTKVANVYRDLGSIRDLVGDEPMTLNDLCIELSEKIWHNTNDGKPLVQVERVPTAADIGRRVKVRRSMSEHWTAGVNLVGFERSGRFVVQSSVTDSITAWQYCIIDQEASE